eukprot:m.261549 g.261549  ORF g.261549 m.261549 type:complete len:653 (-) comp17600_c0_seq1:2002-3960(-)
MSVVALRARLMAKLEGQPQFQLHSATVSEDATKPTVLTLVPARGDPIELGLSTITQVTYNSANRVLSLLQQHDAKARLQLLSQAAYNAWFKYLSAHYPTSAVDDKLMTSQEAQNYDAATQARMEMEVLQTKPWFLGKATREEAEQLLAMHVDRFSSGVFVLRLASEEGYAVTWMTSRGKGHIKIYKVRQTGEYYFATNQKTVVTAMSLEELVLSPHAKKVLGPMTPYSDPDESDDWEATTLESQASMIKHGVVIASQPLADRPLQLQKSFRHRFDSVVGITDNDLDSIYEPLPRTGQANDDSDTGDYETAPNDAMRASSEDDYMTGQFSVPPTMVSGQPQPQTDPPTQQPSSPLTASAGVQALMSATGVIIDQEFEARPFSGSTKADVLLRYLEDAKVKEVHLPAVETDFNGLNSYVVKPQGVTEGDGIYLMAEDDPNSRCACTGTGRPLRMSMFGNHAKPLLTLSKSPTNLMCCCLTCALFGQRPSMEVMLSETKIGVVRQPWWPNITRPTFDATLMDGTKLRVTGQSMFQPGNRIVYNLEVKAAGYSMWTKGGFIIRNQKVLANAMATDADNFEVVFPKNCSVEVKAMLIAIVISIDFMLYEGKHTAMSAGHAVVVDHDDQEHHAEVERRPCWPLFGCCNCYCCSFVCRA